MTGNLLIDNLKFEGGRVDAYKYTAVYLNGPQNLTLQNSFLGSYGAEYDSKMIVIAGSSQT